jgi:hypothetical protein
MTKLRAPLTIDTALARIAGHLPQGWPQMGKITGYQERTVRKWGDTDADGEIPTKAAIALDLAYVDHGGQGLPIYEYYSAAIDAAGAARFAQTIALGALLPDLIHECAEAEVAIALASQPGAPAGARAKALHEVEEAILKLSAARLALAGVDPEHQPP